MTPCNPTLEPQYSKSREAMKKEKQKEKKREVWKNKEKDDKKDDEQEDKDKKTKDDEDKKPRFRAAIAFNRQIRFTPSNENYYAVLAIPAARGFSPAGMKYDISLSV
ncbi:hypothetical protein IFR05_005290 [Cadophora sp. M221]|nr:hypothetical protein IFR05_005290 [Cadophora sp. M221]